MGRGQDRLWRWAVAGILLLAFGLRICRLGAQSLWYDETVSVYLASQDLPALVAHTAGDIHPPGYYLLLHAWTRLAGSSDLAAAYLSLFFGLLLVALAGWLGTRVFGSLAGWLAALLVTISPYNLWYSQEVRMYTLGAVLGVGVVGATLARLGATRDEKRQVAFGKPVPRYLRGSHHDLSDTTRDEKRQAAFGKPVPRYFRRSIATAAVYVLCGALGLWTLYYFAFLLLAVNLMVGAWWLACRRKRRAGWGWLGRWALAQGAVLLLYAPWLPEAWRQATNPPVPPWRGFAGLGQVLLETWSALSLGQSADCTGQTLKTWPVLALFLGLFAAGLLLKVPRSLPAVEGKGQSRPAPRTDEPPACFRWFLAGAVLIPVILIYLASLLTPLYHVRYAFTYSPPFYLIVAAGLVALARPARGRLSGQLWQLLPGLGLAAILVFSGLSIYAYHADPRCASDDHRAAVRYLAGQWRPGDAILVDAGYAYTALVTYWDGDPIAWRGRLAADYQSAGPGPVVVQAGSVDGDPSLGWGDPGSDFYAISRVETAEALGRLFADFDRVWVYRIYDTVTDPDGFIRSWLAGHGVQFEDQVFTGESQLRVQGFLTGRDPLGDTGPAAGAALADGSLQLAASTTLPLQVPVGGALDLALVWRVQSPPQGEAILFAGLFDPDGRRWAQADGRPLGSLYPVAAWSPGALVRCPLRVWIPAGTPPGRYQLEVGWYSLAGGETIWRPWTSGERLALGEVEVSAPANWWALPVPSLAHPAGVAVGGDVRLVGLETATLAGLPGDVLQFDLVWQALVDGPEPGSVVLQLADDAGRVVAEATAAPLGGRVPFARLAAGQVLRDPQSLVLPGDLEPGVYDLAMGRQRADGTWLPVRRGLFPLGSTYPLATIRVLGRAVDLSPPVVQQAVGATFGDTIRLVGYDLAGSHVAARPGEVLQLTLYWQAVQSNRTRYKIFLHLVGEGGPADIRAQADAWPHLPTQGWVPGEYLSDRLELNLPADLPPGSYTLLVGLYDEATGTRLPAFGAAGSTGGGSSPGDSLALLELRLGQ